MTKKRLILFLIMTFVATWGYALMFVYPFANATSAEEISSLQLRIAAIMFIPAICVIITRLITKEGLKNSMIIHCED